MSQDLKCFFGVHKYELVEQQDVVDERNTNVVGINYISRCTNYGGISNDVDMVNNFDTILRLVDNYYKKKLMIKLLIQVVL